MTTPSAASDSRPWIGYVAKLGFRCSPSLITGEPVASSSLIVSRTASSKSASAGPPFCSAATSSAGRGMLPIGSVGIVMRRTLP